MQAENKKRIPKQSRNPLWDTMRKRRYSQKPFTLPFNTAQSRSIA